jgi:hypothetical protein
MPPNRGRSAVACGRTCTGKRAPGQLFLLTFRQAGHGCRRPGDPSFLFHDHTGFEPPRTSPRSDRRTQITQDPKVAYSQGRTLECCLGVLEQPSRAIGASRLEGLTVNESEVNDDAAGGFEHVHQTVARSAVAGGPAARPYGMPAACSSWSRLDRLWAGPTDRRRLCVTGPAAARSAGENRVSRAPVDLESREP